MADSERLREWAREHANPGGEFEDWMVAAGESLVRKCAEIARERCPATKTVLNGPACSSCTEDADAILREYGLDTGRGAAFRGE